MKNKLKNFIKDNKWILITFLVSSIIIMIIYTLNKIAPFGNNSTLTVDFYHQYGPLLNELVDRIKQKESLLYSFNTGGGIPFYRNFLNYLSSPFNLILLLFKKDNIVMAFSIIIALKAVLASVFMCYFLKKSFKMNNALMVVFSLLYAFSGYFCAYYWNIMWLDGIVFLPLITLGVIKIVNERKPLFYICFLALMLFSNYFIAYMICIFEALFFVVYFAYKKNFKIKNIIEKFGMFFLSSLLAAGVVCFALLPLYKSLSTISATGDSFPTFATSFNVLDFFFNHLTGVNSTVFASDELPLPNVFSGIITVFCIILLFFNKKINIRVKLIAFESVLFFLLCFISKRIDFIWHAFHVPNDLPWRYSFIYVFVIITLAYYSLSKIKYVKYTHICFGFAFLFIFCLLSSKLEFKNMDNTKVIICSIFILCYFILYAISKIINMKKDINKIIINIILILITSTEVIYNIDINWNIDHDIETFMQNKKPYMSLINKIRKDDNELYRIEKTNNLTLNDGAWYDYYGISTFSSMAYQDVSSFQRMFGLAGNNINSYYYQNFQTPVYNTIFNVKYILGNYAKNDYYTPIDANNTATVMRYNYPSSFAYLVNKDIKNLTMVSANPFLNQSNFVKLYENDKEVYEKVPIKNVEYGSIIYDDNGNYILKSDDISKKVIITLDNSEKKNIYLYLNSTDIESFYINRRYYSVTSDEFYTADIGCFDEDEVLIEVNLSNENSEFTIMSYMINEDVFKDFSNKINEGSLKVTSYSETQINGNINAQSNNTVFTSIAYDPGWSVYVDGKKVKTNKVLDSYLSFDIKKGNHKIKMSYYPDGLKEGLIISFISALIIIIYTLFIDEKVRKSN